MGRGEFITSVSGTILCMWFSLWLVERNVKGYGVLKSLGDASMDIYTDGIKISFMEHITYAKCFGYYVMFCVRNRHIIYCSKVYSAQIQSISNFAVWRMLVHSYL